MPRRRALHKDKKLVADSRIAVTIGDPAGIGPEVIVRSLASRPVGRSAQLLVLSGAVHLNAIARKLRLKIRFQNVITPEERPLAAIPCYFPEAFPKAIKKGVSQKKLSRLAVR